MEQNMESIATLAKASPSHGCSISVAMQGTHLVGGAADRCE